MTDIVDELRWRGLIALSTDEDALRKAFADGPVTFYCGFDPTAPSLHLGNLVQILTMRRIQQAGNLPLGLVGGATGLIGDPKPTAERVLNDPETVAGWVERLRGQISRFLDFEGPYAARMVNNLDWTSGMSAISLLRDVGKYFRVNNMIAKEAVARRLNSDAGISYTEFSYQILQGMDYLELNRRYGCTLQTGGSDQWGNLTAGTDLIRKADAKSVHALATPLIVKADGTKFGKTESGTVWLDPELTTPYAFYQFWLNADDRDVPNFLRIFSFRSKEEIEELERETTERPAARLAQRALAEEPHHPRPRRRAVRARGRRVQGAVRPGRPRRPGGADPGRRPGRGPEGRGGRTPLGGRPVGRRRPRTEPFGRPPHGQGGRRLPQQRQGDGRGSGAGRGRPAARSLARTAPRQAQPGGGGAGSGYGVTETRRR